MSTEDERLMRQAIKRAREGIEKRQSPFGVCIAMGSDVIVSVHNVVWQKTDITAHAEIVGIREACRQLNSIDLSGCTIYSTAEPCPMCFGAIHWSRIGRIVYGASIHDSHEAGFNELAISNADMKRLGGSDIQLTGDVLKKECVRLFQEWSRSGISPY